LGRFGTASAGEEGEAGSRVLSRSCRSDQPEERVQATGIAREAAPLHIYAITTRRPREPEKWQCGPMNLGPNNRMPAQERSRRGVAHVFVPSNGERLHPARSAGLRTNLVHTSRPMESGLLLQRPTRWAWDDPGRFDAGRSRQTENSKTVASAQRTEKDWASGECSHKEMAVSYQLVQPSWPQVGK
jgi:hypothetical protein